MDKKIILPATLVMLIGLAVFVSATTMTILQTTENALGYQVELPVNKGWNLIASGLTFASDLNYLDETGDIKKSNIKAVYVYSSKINEYLSSYPKYDQRLYSAKDYFNGDEQDIIGQANWIYVDKSGVLKYNTKAIKVTNSRNLFSGWNFVSITPEMFYEKDGTDVFSWNGVKGNCNFEKIYAWNPEEQNWLPISADTESFDFNDFYAMGMVVKVSNNCKLGTSGSIIAPPALPIPDEDSGTPTSTDTEYKSISSYSLTSASTDSEECSEDNSLCFVTSRLQYRDSASSNIIFINLIEITRGTKAQTKEYLAKSVEGVLETKMVGSNKLYILESHELYWFTDAEEPGLILSQEGKITPTENGEGISYGTATGDNPVTAYWLSKYPAKQID